MITKHLFYIRVKHAIEPIDNASNNIVFVDLCKSHYAD